MKSSLKKTLILALCVIISLPLVLSAATGRSLSMSEDGDNMTITYALKDGDAEYTVPNKKNYISGGFAATDDLGRSLYTSEQVGSYRKDERYVGLFYFLWHGEHGDSGVFDLQKIIDKVGADKASNINCGLYGPVGAMHWFSEPLYGYYYASDEWVMRKHAELLTNANIDFLYIDVTNGYAYIHNALKLMKVLHGLNEDGYDAPQIVFYTHTSAEATVRQLYSEIYLPKKYEDTWFMLDGKPVIVAPDNINITGSLAITDYFTVKREQWPNDKKLNENAWPWMDFEWPQRIFTDKEGKPSAVSVSIAQHSGTIAFSHSSLFNNHTNRGRSFKNPDKLPSTSPLFDSVLKKSYEDWKADPTVSMTGENFQAQWDHAIASDAQFVLVTGWNEWVAQRQPTNDGSVWFVDTSSMEFSRDAEMMRGGYFDNYYMQLIQNVQRLKGTAPVIVQSDKKTIDLDGGFSQWDDVLVEYSDPSGDTVRRAALGFGQTTYKNFTGRNDIVAAKAANDKNNLYFYTETDKDIVGMTAKSAWMQLFLDADADQSTGWYGYDFIINHERQNDQTTTVAKYCGKDGEFAFEKVGEIPYTLDKKQLMLSVPLEMLGIENSRAIEINFKWADSKKTYGTMEDFYIDGDAAPLGRLNFVYQNYLEGKSDITPEPETDAQTPAPTESAADTPKESESETNAPASGCRSACSAALLLPALFFIPTKKKFVRR